MGKTLVNGILLIYHRRLPVDDATVVMQHVNAFQRHSRYGVWSVNTELGFPGALNQLQFQTIVLHYSLFGIWPYMLGAQFRSYLQECRASYKIAFFQDEYRFCQQRFAFINRYQIDGIYSLLEPAYFESVYQKHTTVKKIVYTLAGYVDTNLVAMSEYLTKPDDERKIDIGYRARELPFYLGKGGQEKHLIGVGFRERATYAGLRLNIETDVRKRIYGLGWYKFLANCKAVLGVEAGGSVFDVDDVVRPECERLVAENPDITFDEIYVELLQNYEDRIYYRTISPRHFEAAALKVCQILFEGKYSGLMQPMVHYIPLKKDFSNFDEVIELVNDGSVRRELAENAYRDLIASNAYGYDHFVEGFDEELLNLGFQPDLSASEVQYVTALLAKGDTYRRYRTKVKSVKYLSFPGKQKLILLSRLARNVGG